MTFPSVPENVPFLTTDQMIEVDRAMMEDFTIDLVRMMENAGRNLAHLARVRFLGADPRGKTVVVLAGTGGNGGGALVCARRLHNWGAHVGVVLTRPEDEFTPVPAHQLKILHAMGVAVYQTEAVARVLTPQLVIDGVIGYSLKGAPFGNAAHLIRWANEETAPTLALDAPSGVDTTTGTVFDPAIRATATMTLALPKEGLRAPGIQEKVGELYLADISVPPSLYRGPGLNFDINPIFAQSDIVRLR